jgi:hypothetical protein
MIRTLLATAFVICTVVPAATAQRGVSRRSDRGDTVVVTSTAIGLWGPRRAAVEVQRITAAHDGEPFGMITAMTALPDGGVAIFDGKGASGPVLWVLDAKGRFERRIGREGSGPGEYRSCNDCLVSNVDGSIGLLDNRNRRITTYLRNGTVRSTAPAPEGAGFGGVPRFLPGPPGSYFARLELTPSPATPITDPQQDERYGFILIAENGKVLDTVPPPKSWLRKPAQSLLEPRMLWHPLRDGRVAVGATDQMRILIHDRKGPRTNPVFLEGITARIPFGTDERKMLRAHAAYANAHLRKPPSRQAQLPAEPPTLKPLFRGFETDHTGRLFLRLHSAGVTPPPGLLPPEPVFMGEDGRPIPTRPSVTHMEPPLFAAFERDGRFLGETHFPVSAVKVSFVGNTAWVILKDPDGEDVLVKYTIPGS